MNKLIEYYNELTNNDFNEEELRVELDSLNALKKICKWLVYNDKIDLEELTAQAQEKIRLNLFGYKDNKELDTDLLLMLLSIQNNSIEFLIDLLK